MTTLTKNAAAISKLAQRVRIGNYFTILGENEIDIYQVRRDNVNISSRAQYVCSLDSKVEAEGLVKKLNTREINARQLQEYLVKREEDEIKSKAFVGDTWGHPPAHL